MPDVDGVLPVLVGCCIEQQAFPRALLADHAPAVPVWREDRTLSENEPQSFRTRLRDGAILFCRSDATANDWPFTGRRPYELALARAVFVEVELQQYLGSPLSLRGSSTLTVWRNFPSSV